MMSIATSPIEEDTEINNLFYLQKKGYNLPAKKICGGRRKDEERHFFANIYNPADELSKQMTDEGSFFSRLTKKQLYIFAMIGILVLAAGAVLSYTAKEKLKSDGLTPEEEAKESYIYAVSKIISMVGFIIALIPSVKILQNTIPKKNPPKESAADDNQKKDSIPSKKNY